MHEDLVDLHQLDADVRAFTRDEIEGVKMTIAQTLPDFIRSVRSELLIIAMDEPSSRHNTPE